MGPFDLLRAFRESKKLRREGIELDKRAAAVQMDAARDHRAMQTLAQIDAKS